jgi:hypothetical protein
MIDAKYRADGDAVVDARTGRRVATVICGCGAVHRPGAAMTTHGPIGGTCTARPAGDEEAARRHETRCSAHARLLAARMSRDATG